jgi:hypothetical protein
VDFDGLSKWLSNQIGVVVSAPIPFVVCAIIVGFLIWRAMEWRYRAVIDGLNHRIGLRDDTIAHFDKRVPISADGAGRGSAPLVAKAPGKLETLGAELTSVPIVEDRVFVTKYAASDLMNLFEGKTALQTESVAKPYIGKWIEISMPVRNVFNNENETSVLLTAEETSVRFVFMHFNKARERLDLVDVGDTLTGFGQIRELSSMNMHLYDCEMIKAS